MSLRVISLAVIMGLAVGACDKAEEPATATMAEDQSAAMPSAPLGDGTSDATSAAIADMQSAALDAQDATAALSEAASAAVGMARDTSGKK